MMPDGMGKNLGSIIFLVFYPIDAECQYWLNETSGLLTSPYFGSKQQYYHNLNCTWLLTAEPGSYINIQIDSFKVKHKSSVI